MRLRRRWRVWPGRRGWDSAVGARGGMAEGSPPRKTGSIAILPRARLFIHSHCHVRFVFAKPGTRWGRWKFCRCKIVLPAPPHAPTRFFGNIHLWRSTLALNARGHSGNGPVLFWVEWAVLALSGIDRPLSKNRTHTPPSSNIEPEPNLAYNTTTQSPNLSIAQSPANHQIHQSTNLKPGPCP